MRESRRRPPRGRGVTAARDDLEASALDLLGEELRHRVLHLLERELLLLEHLAQPGPDLLLAERLREADERLVGGELEMLRRERRYRVRKVAQQVVVLCNAAHQLLVFRHEAAEARALFRLGRNAEAA